MSCCCCCYLSTALAVLKLFNLLGELASNELVQTAPPKQHCARYPPLRHQYRVSGQLPGSCFAAAHSRMLRLPPAAADIKHVILLKYPRSGCCITSAWCLLRMLAQQALLQLHSRVCQLGLHDVYHLGHSLLAAGALSKWDANYRNQQLQQQGMQGSKLCK